jgi:hypothetical protein
MPPHALLSPLQGFTLLQLLLWPWIYARTQATQASAYMTGGFSIACRWHVTPLGHVFIYDAPFVFCGADGAPLETGSHAYLRLAHMLNRVDAQVRRAISAARCALTRARRFVPIAQTAHARTCAPLRLDSS